MANGDIFKDIKDALTNDPQSITGEMRDKFILSGIIQVYDRVEKLEEKIEEKYEKRIVALEKNQTPMLIFYRISVTLGTVIVGLLAAFFFKLLTGEVSVVFK
jgi:hypothetical protein